MNTSNPFRSYYIYLITNIKNLKSYVGFTENIDRRWKQHKNDYKRIKTPLYESMKKHGIENFEFNIIYVNQNREHTLLEMEPYFIGVFNTYNKGYNCNKGGLNCNTDIMRKNSSKRMKTNNPMFRKEIKEKVNKKLKLLRIEHPEKFKHSDERKKRAKERMLGANNPNFGKPETYLRLMKKRVCEYCGKEICASNYTRWHGKNCKSA